MAETETTCIFRNAEDLCEAEIPQWAWKAIPLAQKCDLNIRHVDDNDCGPHCPCHKPKGGEGLRGEGWQQQSTL